MGKRRARGDRDGAGNRGRASADTDGVRARVRHNGKRTGIGVVEDDLSIRKVDAVGNVVRVGIRSLKLHHASVRDQERTERHVGIDNSKRAGVLHRESLSGTVYRATVPHIAGKAAAHVVSHRSAHRCIVVKNEIADRAVCGKVVVDDGALALVSVAGDMDDLVTRDFRAGVVGGGRRVVVEVKRTAVRNDDGRRVRRRAERMVGEVVADLEHAVRDDDWLRVESARCVERERALALLVDRPGAAELARAVERHVAVGRDRHVVRIHVGRKRDRRRVGDRRVRVGRERDLRARRVRPRRDGRRPDAVAGRMPEKDCRRTAAGGGRVVEDSVRDGERARDACRNERRELRRVARANAAEDGNGHAVREREVRHVNRHRAAAGQNERPAGNVEERVLRGLQDRARSERERGAVGHRHLVRERCARIDDDRIGLRNRRVGEAERGAAVHGGGAVAKRARALHGGDAAVQDRAAGVLLQELLHDQLAFALLDDLAGGGPGDGVEVHGVAGGVDGEGVAVEVEAPVAVLAVRRPVGVPGMVDREVVFRREARVPLEHEVVVPAEHSEATRADEHVGDVEVDVVVAGIVLDDGVRLHRADVALEVLSAVVLPHVDRACRDEAAAVQLEHELVVHVDGVERGHRVLVDAQVVVDVLVGHGGDRGARETGAGCDDERIAGGKVGHRPVLGEGDVAPERMRGNVCVRERIIRDGRNGAAREDRRRHGVLHVVGAGELHGALERHIRAGSGDDLRDRERGRAAHGNGRVVVEADRVGRGGCRCGLGAVDEPVAWRGPVGAVRAVPNVVSGRGGVRQHQRATLHRERSRRAREAREVGRVHAGEEREGSGRA